MGIIDGDGLDENPTIFALARAASRPCDAAKIVVAKKINARLKTRNNGRKRLVTARSPTACANKPNNKYSS
jgi:hypothetical protein